MKEILIMLVRGAIVTGLKTLILLYKKNNGETKGEQLKGHIASILVGLKPIAQDTKNTIDDTIIGILEESLTD